MKKTQKKTTKSKSETMTVAEFCALTGFERSWLSRLASRGHFPPSVNGVYQREKAIRGLFRYLKEREALQLQKMELNAIEIEIKKIELEERKSQYWPKEKVKTELEAMALGIKGFFHRALEVEWPAKALGKTRPELYLLGVEMTDKICSEFRAKAEPWMK